ncbi:hypothetical protein [Plantactinospora sp. KLBMP9567]|uniref:hypothetical protein n=1 Tax=Plantactinospora sp. KLBMP9567 TaxID=3085900 RepID=UPI0029828703|nr:hypothetical protein [Plantactinospora sp. KLBMP9567]MDW5327778.1 hypothetical protein [Plantactinospora sp. KLBMP9567]
MRVSEGRTGSVPAAVLTVALVAGCAAGPIGDASVSPDGGWIWRTTALPEVDGDLGDVLPVLAADGDAWLVGYHAEDRTRAHPPGGGVWLGLGSGTERRWVEVRLARM